MSLLIIGRQGYANYVSRRKFDSTIISFSQCELDMVHLSPPPTKAKVVFFHLCQVSFVRRMMLPEFFPQASHFFLNQDLTKPVVFLTFPKNVLIWDRANNRQNLLGCPIDNLGVNLSGKFGNYTEWIDHALGGEGDLAPSIPQAGYRSLYKELILHNYPVVVE